MTRRVRSLSGVGAAHGLHGGGHVGAHERLMSLLQVRNRFIVGQLRVDVKYLDLTTFASRGGDRPVVADGGAIGQAHPVWIPKAGDRVVW